MDTPSPYQSKERFPVTPASRHMIFRSYPSPEELQRSQRQLEHGWPHIRPGSVLVAAMGNHWKGPSWNKVIDMVDFTQRQGIYCGLSEIQDRCLDPYDALGTMRNEAILTALGEGFQYLCYIDNDIQPEEDHLTRLLAWQMPIVAPYIVEPGTGTKLFGPNTINPGNSLQRAKWSVLSMLLFDTAIFRNLGPDFWRDATGADEGWHFQKLHYYGYHLYIDTTLQLVIGGRPLFPLALNRLSSGAMRDVEAAAGAVAAHIGGIFGRRGIPLLDADKQELAGALTEFIRIAKGERSLVLQAKIEHFVEPPDRRAIDPKSPWIKDGEYAPFLIKAEQAQTQKKTQEQAAVTNSSVHGTSGDISKALQLTGIGNG